MRPHPTPTTVAHDSSTGPRRELVRKLRARGIRDTAVLDALGRVARHALVPEASLDQAYEDRPLPIGFEQTISQPYIVALMTELARIRPGDRVLEIGTGSGYQTAVLRELGAEVYTVEIIAELGHRARRNLDRLRYDGIHFRIGDGYRGWPEAGPFDAVVLTAAPPSIPPALEAQLAVGGRLVAPVGTQSQDLVLVERSATGLSRREITAVRFVPMTGEAQRPRP